MKYFKSCITTNYANFSGRARRKEFWHFALINFIICLPLGIIVNILQRTGEPGGSFMLAAIIILIIALALVIPSLAVGVRRLHDINKSGWWMLINLVPYVGSFILLYFYAKAGDKGENQYGPDPKALDNEE
ncbi:MAG: DUF805 domain-containing protein [Paludibacteraceae bacterium]|nr:DUF805 domain-containing protein [Paludibacteraceae bacterium]MBR5973349.1 DUF805 domain-containing protein [Paludibacteraceae bacterium]